MDIVVPVYNEAEQLAPSITALRTFLDTSFPFAATVTIADNASTDGTWRIAVRAGRHPRRACRPSTSTRRGGAGPCGRRGRRSTAAVVAYMDVDLATGLDALLPLVAPLLSGHSDVAIGTRLGPGAHVVRGARREFISRGLQPAAARRRCGARAPTPSAGSRRCAARRPCELLPLVEDDEWFFDTELLVTAQRIGLRIHEVPVDWVDDTDSRVDVLHTAIEGPARACGACWDRPRDSAPFVRPARPDSDIHVVGRRRSPGPASPSVPVDRWGDRVTGLVPGAARRTGWGRRSG